MDLEKLYKERKLINDVSEKEIGEKVTVAGWLYDSRELGKLIFLIVRDISGEMQVTGFKGETKDEVFKAMKGINRESVVVIKGLVKKSPKAPGGREIAPESIEIIAEAEQPLPLDVSDRGNTELPKRLDHRYLDLHTRRSQAIFKIQATISMSFREFFDGSGYMEFQPPSLISASSEGGTELFPAKYFEKSAYLAQSPQLYKQVVSCAMEKCFTITPVWRAEKHNTIRHLNESRQMDMEAAFMGAMDAMKVLDECVAFMIEKVLEKNVSDLEILDLKLKKPGKAVYLTYEETVKELGKKSGSDLSPEDERKLCAKYGNKVVFVYDWPMEIKPFYIMPKDGDAGAEYSEGFDALFGGVEISSGGQRIHLANLLTEMLKKKNLNPKDFKSYIDGFRYGAPPHSGWSIGLERFTWTLLGLDNIREAVLFPRDRDRLTP